MISETERTLIATAVAAIFTTNLPGWQILLAPTYVASTAIVIQNNFGWYARDRPTQISGVHSPQQKR